MDTESLAAVFKALSDQNRLVLLENIAAESDICACKLLDRLEIEQSTLSHHMQVLVGCGLVTKRREGKWMRYRLNGECLKVLRDFLASVEETRQNPPVLEDDGRYCC